MKRIFKISFAVIIALTLTFSLSFSTFAQGTVTYDGNAKDFIFAPGSEYSPTDLFTEFKNVMPGDTLTQSITVRNDIENEVKVNVYMRALGADEGSEEFLSQLKLTVAKSENNTMEYMFDATADKTDGLADWVLLGTLYSGGEVNLEVVLSVPIETGNEFANTVGTLKWEFMVEEMAVEPDDPQPPETGDSYNIYLYIALAVISAFAILALILAKRKAQVKEN